MLFAQYGNASLSQSPRISFRMHLHCRICEIFHSKYQNNHCSDGPMAQIGNMLHGNSNYRKYRAFNRNLHNALGFRSLICSQCPWKILAHNCVSVCFPPLFYDQRHGDNNNGQFIPSSPLPFFLLFRRFVPVYATYFSSSAI